MRRRDTLPAMKVFLGITGATMLALVLYGLLTRRSLVPDLVPTGTPDAWLHGVLAVTMLVASAFRSRKRRTPLGSA